MSIRRQNRWMLSHITATALFWAGITILPAYLLQDSLWIRGGQVVLFGALTVLAGKRLLWLYFITIATAITFFHVLVPTGAVLFEVVGIPVTTGAIRTGAFKALTIIGMVFISLVSVRADLEIPGRLGAVAARTFWAFEQIMERREELRLSSPLASTDAMLLGIYESMGAMDRSDLSTQARKQTAAVTSPLGWAVIGIVVAAQWVALIVPLP